MSKSSSKNTFQLPVNTLVGTSISNFNEVVSGHQTDKNFKTKYYLTKFFAGILGAIGKYEEWHFKKKIADFEIKETPIFIIGFWRSGTTLMHNLITQNPDYGYVTTYQAVFPKLCMLNQWWIQGIAKHLMPKTRPYDNMKLDFEYPQEEEIAMGNLQSLSFYNFFYFPKDIDFYAKHDLLLQDVSPEKLQIWKELYIRLIKTALINSNGKRFVSKNPPNTARVKLLLEMFPDAKFIYMHRNSYDAIHSFQRFMHAVHDGIKLQNYDHKVHTHNMIRIYKTVIEQYNEQKKLIPPGQLIEVKFEEFEKNMRGQTEKVYKTLNLPDFEKALPFIEKHIAEICNHERKITKIDPEFIKLVDSEIGNLVEE
jgi:hypothetical protein